MVWCLALYGMFKTDLNLTDKVRQIYKERTCQRVQIYLPLPVG